MATVDERAREELGETKRSVPVASGPYGHPFHPMFVTVPIGAWIGSLVLDIGTRVVDDPDGLGRAAWWMIAIGIIGALVAAVFGFIDLLSLPRGTAVFRQALIHMALNLAVTAAFVVSFFWRQDRGVDQETSGGQIALSAVALGFLAVSGWIGGQLSYRFGVRVAAEDDQVDGYR